MFDLGGLGEFFFIVIAALVLLGPKEIPTVLRTVGKFTQKIRMMSAGVRGELQKYVHEGELQEYDHQIKKAIATQDNTKNKHEIL